MKRLLFIISAPPYSNKRGTAQLDAAMVAAAFDAEVSLMFSQDGIYSLLPNQSAHAIDQRAFSKVLEALSDYEVNQLYVCSESLASRGIVLSDLMPVQPLDLAAQRTLIATQDAVIGAAL
jgi:tRNA 2-thiouridine synthesizing protein C